MSTHTTGHRAPPNGSTADSAPAGPAAPITTIGSAAEPGPGRRFGRRGILAVIAAAGVLTGAASLITVQSGVADVEQADVVVLTPVVRAQLGARAAAVVAAAPLAAGLVDTRVCTLLAVLLGTHRLVLAGFTPAAPGAGPGRPLAGFVIAAVDGEPTTGKSPAVAALTAAVRTQQAPYLAMSIGPTPAGGPRGLRIVFSEPEPPGLLPGTDP